MICFVLVDRSVSMSAALPVVAASQCVACERAPGCTQRHGQGGHRQIEHVRGGMEGGGARTSTAVAKPNLDARCEGRDACVQRVSVGLRLELRFSHPCGAGVFAA